MSDKEFEKKGKLGSLLILDVDAPTLQALEGQYSSVDMAGMGNGPGDCHGQRQELVKAGFKVSSMLSNKEPYILAAVKKWDTVVINGTLITIKDKIEFHKALKSRASSVLSQAASLEGFSKNGEIKIGKKNFNIFK